MSKVPLDEVCTGDLLMVGPGEVVPVDIRVEGSLAILDESALTGEADPVERAAGDLVRSGVLNAGGVFDLRVSAAERSRTTDPWQGQPAASVRATNRTGCCGAVLTERVKTSGRP